MIYLGGNLRMIFATLMLKYIMKHGGTAGASHYASIPCEWDFLVGIFLFHRQGEES